jgi:FAD synthetase
VTLEELTLRYIRKAEKVLSDIRIAQDLRQVNRGEVDGVVEAAGRYLEDAKYYRERGKAETGLASVAYCEGLLDALRLLGLVEFSWPEEGR